MKAMKQRHFKPLVDRVCSSCNKLVAAKWFGHHKRENINEIVYYQHARCRFCKAQSEQERRNKMKK
jgi:hypothetical protein